MLGREKLLPATGTLRNCFSTSKKLQEFFGMILEEALDRTQPLPVRSKAMMNFVPHFDEFFIVATDWHDR
jgi:polyphosphate kinase